RHRCPPGCGAARPHRDRHPAPAPRLPHRRPSRLRRRSAEKPRQERDRRVEKKEPAASGPSPPSVRSGLRRRLYNRYNRRVNLFAADELLRDLNPSQLEAVTAGEGPLLVLAGAGSGKTRVIAHRIAYTLAARGVSPRNMLAVTFTNKAAEEMARRVETLTASLGIRAPLVTTFHSACVRILRQHVKHLGYKPHFTIYDEDDRHSLV